MDLCTIQLVDEMFESVFRQSVRIVVNAIYPEDVPHSSSDLDVGRATLKAWGTAVRVTR